MRISAALLVLASLLSGGAVSLAAAEEPLSPAAANPSATRDDAATLDKLFAELKRQRNDKAAERIAGRIWTEWFKSGSATVDLLMKWAGDAIDKKKYDAALDFLDQVTVLAPNYAEGWNRRATVHYLTKNYAKSMADIEKTLELEPRHFGALSGMAAILKDSGRKQLALDAYQRVLAIYPMMRNAQNEVATLSEELAGEGI